MRIAALDLGTNSFLCLIGDVSSTGEFKVLHDESEVVRLGQELQSTGELHVEALKRADACLKRYAETIKRFNTDRIQAVATAAAREAKNSDEFNKICDRHNIPLVTISGDQEARMSFRGAISQNEKSKCLLIDIGGGSTEYIVGTPQKIEFGLSLPYGAVKLTEKFITKQPVLPEDEVSLRKFLSGKTEETWAQIETLAPTKIWAVAGTPTALVAAMLGEFNAEKIEGYKLDRKTLAHWINNFRQTTVEEKKKQYNLGARADVIFAGTVILEELLKRLNMEEIFVSTKGIRYGLAYQMADEFMSNS